MHDNDDTGIQIGTDVIGSSGMNNTIRNCDSYRNYDAVDQRRERRRLRREGIVRNRQPVRGLPRLGERRRRLRLLCLDRHDHADELLGVPERAGLLPGADSDGNGFKLGGDDMGGNHQLMMCSAWDNKARGFTNNSGSNSTCSGCTSCANGTSGDQGVSGITTSGCPTSRTGARNIDGTIP